MKSKQLANVLIRILGLSMIAHGIPSLLNNLITVLQFAADNSLRYRTAVGDSRVGILFCYALIPIVIGVALIFTSRWLVEKLFQDEAE